MDNEKTLQQYNDELKKCRDIFEKKSKDYGGQKAVSILREESLFDQIYIKLSRIRTLQEKEKRKEEKKIGDTKITEFIGIINYNICALMRRKHSDKLLDMTLEELMSLYDSITGEIRDLMIEKNSDYGEAWRQMKQQSFVDLSLQKLFRIEAIHANDEKLLASEGVDANFHDIVNYSIFGLILITEGKHTA